MSVWVTKSLSQGGTQIHPLKIQKNSRSQAMLPARCPSVCPPPGCELPRCRDSGPGTWLILTDYILTEGRLFWIPDLFLQAAPSL